MSADKEQMKGVVFEIPESQKKFLDEQNKLNDKFREISAIAEERLKVENDKFIADIRASREENERHKRYEEAIIELAERKSEENCESIGIEGSREGLLFGSRRKSARPQQNQA